MENLKDKNPEQVNGLTPLHLAAKMATGKFNLFWIVFRTRCQRIKMAKHQLLMLALENRHFELSLRLINSHLQRKKLQTCNLNEGTYV